MAVRNLGPPCLPVLPKWTCPHSRTRRVRASQTHFRRQPNWLWPIPPEPCHNVPRLRGRDPLVCLSLRLSQLRARVELKLQPLPELAPAASPLQINPRFASICRTAVRAERRELSRWAADGQAAVCSGYICSKVSIPSTKRPCFKTRAVRSHRMRREFRVRESAFRTGQDS